MAESGNGTIAMDAAEHCDVVVVGAEIGGVYAVHKFRQDGLSALGFEGGSNVGGVWFHNRYPGARVDVESLSYCYFFSPELYNDWRWSEQYATQAELLAYINHVADRFDIRRHISFNTWVTSASWRSGRWHVGTGDGRTIVCRFLVMATGNLSAARKPDFPGLDRFRGEWVRTSHWPDRPVPIKGRRVGVIGTGASGVQVIPVLAQDAEHLYVFQRTANYSAPAHNGPIDEAFYADVRSRAPRVWADLLATRVASFLDVDTRPANTFTPEERLRQLERKWTLGGHAMNVAFSDQGIDTEVNTIVADFVRNKIREIVDDPVVAETLCPFEYPIGTRRLCVDTDYYKTFNRDNVTLVNLRADPIAEIHETGIRTSTADYELDLIVFSLGFQAFTGQLDKIDIRNERGEHPTDGWKRGPRTYLGLMTGGFPNFFLLTGPGSPSVLANMFVHNEYHVDWIARLIAYMNRNGFDAVEPTQSAQDQWTQHVTEVAAPLLRLQVQNYMVHVNSDDQSRVFIPYVGGFNRYVTRCEQVADTGYEGFAFASGS